MVANATTANRKAHVMRTVSAILKTYCRPIHYGSRLFADLHELFADTKKTAGPKEAFRQMFGNERDNGAAIQNGYIYLKDWKRFDPYQLVYDTPAELMQHRFSPMAIAKGYRDFHLRKPYMIDKGLPEHIRINAHIAEQAAIEIFKRIDRSAIIQKEITDVRRSCDHDLRIKVSGRVVKCDMKSSQSRKETWSIGKDMTPKSDVLYVFTTGADLFRMKITICGFRAGRDIEHWPANKEIKRQDIFDIHYLLGAIAYRNRRTWIKK